MNKLETMKIMAVLQANYPDSFKNYDDEQLETLVKIWTSVLADATYKEVSNAVLAHIATDTGRFMPPVGIIRNMLVKLNEPQEITEMEAWNLVAKAVANSNYNSGTEFEKLPDDIKQLVGSPATLREWAGMDSDQFNTVVQSNFMRSYKVKSKSNKEYKALPQSVKTFIESSIENVKLLQ